MEKNEEGLLSVLNYTLSNCSVNECYYEINGYADDRVCLEKDGEKWIVYIGDRGRKSDITTFNNLRDACIFLLKSISTSVDQENRLVSVFQTRYAYIIATKIKPRNEIYTAKHSPYQGHRVSVYTLRGHKSSRMKIPTRTKKSTIGEETCFEKVVYNVDGNELRWGKTGKVIARRRAKPSIKQWKHNRLRKNNKSQK